MIKTRSNGKGGMTVSEAGRKGGERVRDERGVEFYQEIGRKGGELGGRKGGEAVRDKYGPSFYEEIGRKGGQKVRELIEQGKKRILEREGIHENEGTGSRGRRGGQILPTTA